LLVGVKLAPAATTLIYWGGVAANIIAAHKLFANTLFGGFTESELVSFYGERHPMVDAIMNKIGTSHF
jgi:hypothetical protein